MVHFEWMAVDCLRVFLFWKPNLAPKEVIFRCFYYNGIICVCVCVCVCVFAVGGTLALNQCTDDECPDWEGSILPIQFRVAFKELHKKRGYVLAPWVCMCFDLFFFFLTCLLRLWGKATCAARTVVWCVCVCVCVCMCVCVCDVWLLGAFLGEPVGGSMAHTWYDTQMMEPSRAGVIGPRVRRNRSGFRCTLETIRVRAVTRCLI